MNDDERKQRKAAWNKAWRLRHRDRILAKEATWRSTRHAELREASKRWRRDHPEQAAAFRKKAYYAKRDELVQKKRLYNKARRDEINRKSREYEAAHKDKKQARMARYRQINREVLRAKNSAYAKANRAVVSAKAMRRNAAKQRAIPPWTDRDALKPIYAEAARMTSSSGIPHHVDHIVPLRGKTVCGLHVPWNLRVIPRADNCRKSNKFPFAA